MSFYAVRSQSLAEGVPLSFQVPDEGKNLLLDLQNAGLKNAILFGGYLRDNWNKVAPNDMDIMVDVPDSGNSWRVQNGFGMVFGPYRNHQSDLDQCVDMIKSIPDITVTDAKFKRGQYGAIIGDGRISALYKNETKLDIVAVRNPMKPEQVAMAGDAPINSIAGDATGSVWAHPQFEAHSEAGLYQVNRWGVRAARDAVDRHRSLSQRFEQAGRHLSLDLQAKNVGLPGVIAAKAKMFVASLSG